MSDVLTKIHFTVGLFLPHFYQFWPSFTTIYDGLPWLFFNRWNTKRILIFIYVYIWSRWFNFVKKLVLFRVIKYEINFWNNSVYILSRWIQNHRDFTSLRHIDFILNLHCRHIREAKVRFGSLTPQAQSSERNFPGTILPWRDNFDK